MSLVFTKVEGSLESLPINTLPAMLSARRDPRRNRLLLPAKQPSEQVEYQVVGPETLGDPVALSAMLRGLDAPYGNWLIGPETPEEPEGVQRADIPKLPVGFHGPPVLAIVDVGIAFWNPRFWPEGTSRFEAVGFLEVPALADRGVAEESPPLKTRVSLIRREDDGSGGPTLRDYRGLASKPGGQRLVRDALAEAYPGSFYGLAPEIGALWHGTAMADLAAGQIENAEADPVLFGLELPAAALLDSGGDTLQSVLQLAVHAVLEMTRDFSNAPLTVVLGFAFTGGPLDGSHPAVTEMAQVLRALPREVTVVLPAGNHRLDRCHTVLSDSQGTSRTVGWRLAPGDTSTNTVELCYEGETPPEISLALPSGEEVHTRLVPGEFAWLVLDGEVIGALHHLPGKVGDARKLRLALAETVAREDRIGAPYGEWLLGAAGIDSDVKLWILRDDGGDRLGQSGLRKRSAFPREAAMTLGTASVLATGSDAALQSVAAEQRHGKSPGRFPAPYSGELENGVKMDRAEVVDDLVGPPGRAALGNGSGRRFRFSGTSAAAAVAAGKIAL